jgi:hypothetical protein
VKDDSDVEVETSSFPENCQVALMASVTIFTEKMEATYVSPRTSKHLSKHLGPGASVGDPDLTPSQSSSGSETTIQRTP